MASNAESRLKQVRQLLQEIAKEAPHASASIKKVTESLDAMSARPAPKNIGFAFPKGTEVRQLASGFQELDTKLGGADARLQAMARHAKITALEVDQIRINMERVGASVTKPLLLPATAGAGAGPQAGLIASLGLTEEDLAEATRAGEGIIDMTEKVAQKAARQPLAPPSATAATFGAGVRGQEMHRATIAMKGDITALNQELITSENITKAGGVALEALAQKYDTFGFKVQDAKAQILANSKELEAHATIVKKVGDEYKIIGQAQQRVSLETLTPVKAAPPGADLKKLLGAQRLPQFERQLKKLGLRTLQLKGSTRLVGLHLEPKSLARQPELLLSTSINMDAL
jgi:hypothetical protein